MGVLTHAQLVTEALELAGNTGLTTRAQTWLGLVLRSLFEDFSFPVQGGGPHIPVYSLVAGTGEVDLPTSGTAVVRAVKKIWVTPTGARDWSELAVYHVSNVPGGNIPDNVGGAYSATLPSMLGRPTSALLIEGQDTTSVLFRPKPDQTYFVLFYAEGLSSPMTYSANTVNLYPKDDVVIQGIYAWALKHQQDERAASEWQQFEQMAKKDRVRYGMMNNANNTVGLSKRHFRGGGNTGGNNSSPSSTGWMGPP